MRTRGRQERETKQAKLQQPENLHEKTNNIIKDITKCNQRT